MNKTTLLCLITITIPVISADLAWIPVKVKDEKVNFNWVRRDTLGFQWDINVYGMVDDGLNDAYDGAMQLQINNSRPSPAVHQARMVSNNEILIGPWKYGHLEIARMIYVDNAKSYCRWIDLIRNTSSTKQTFTISHFTNLGGSAQSITTSSGGNSPAKDDWGMVTGQGGGSRPDICHIWGMKESKLKPKATVSGDNVRVNYSLTVKAKETIGLCNFQMQRRGAGIDNIKNFPLKAELKKIYPEVRKLLINMPSTFVSIGGEAFIRTEEACVGLRNKSEKKGKLLQDSYKLQTPYGIVVLKAEIILGLYLPTIGDNRAFVALNDGQIIVGKLETKEIVIQEKDGIETSIPLSNLLSITYPVSPAKPERLVIKNNLIDLRSGASLAFDPKSIDLTFLTEYGRCKLPMGSLKMIDLAPGTGRFHAAQFQNGTSLSGLLLAHKIETDLL